MKYYKVTAKCGHVGKYNYYKGNFYVIAENGKIAANIVRYMPRVKHDHKDAIISVEETTKLKYREGKIYNNENLYYKCTNIQQQRQFINEISPFIYREEKTIKKTTKKHSLKSVYNFDPDFEKIKYNKDITYFNY